MERIKALNLYQKVVLCFLCAMFVAFTAAYCLISSRHGYEYKGEILLPHMEGENVVYSGKIDGREILITVTADKTVTFSSGENIYGPFTAREDPAAIPEEVDFSESMTGVEILDGESVFFRGGVLPTGGRDSSLVLFDEDGNLSGFGITYYDGDGIEKDPDGNPIDQLAPSASTILHLMNDPELTSKGEWLGWFCGALISFCAAVSILYSEELFRWNLSFRIRNADSAEPSEWAMTERYISWTALPLLALFIYIVGLME